MVDLWGRREEPETADIRRTLHAARVLENDPTSPTHLRAFAWNLAVEIHKSVGWDLPADLNLASCCAAAASVTHASSLLISDISEQVHGLPNPVLLLGALGAGRSIFGRWDLVPASGAVLVALDLEENGQPSATNLPTNHGIHWASPGHLREVYEDHASLAALNGDQVLLPNPALIVGRSMSRHLDPEDPEALIFCGAARAAANDGAWADVTQIAKALGHRDLPIELAVQLGIDGRLGLEVGRARRSVMALRRFIRR